MNLTITYITARREPHFEWFVDSITNQILPGDDIELFCVDLYAKERNYTFPDWVKVVEPKPSVWHGPNRLTKEEWWGVASFRNTGLCLAKHDWFAVADDRSCPGPLWLKAVRDAIKGKYAVAGSYEKVHDLVVENGIAKSWVTPTYEGRPTGKDPRWQKKPRPTTIYGNLFFGCTSAMPLEWALQVNGWDESSNGLGLEDCVFGQMLSANGYPMKHDQRMFLLEDRTPTKCDVGTVRMDKGKSPKDKSHAFLDRTSGKLQATHWANLRQIREQLKRGEGFPIETHPTHDWYDGEPLATMMSTTPPPPLEH